MAETTIIHPGVAYSSRPPASPQLRVDRRDAPLRPVVLAKVENSAACAADRPGPARTTGSLGCSAARPPRRAADLSQSPFLPSGARRQDRYRAVEQVATRRLFESVFRACWARRDMSDRRCADNLAAAGHDAEAFCRGRRQGGQRLYDANTAEAPHVPSLPTYVEGEIFWGRTGGIFSPTRCRAAARPSGADCVLVPLRIRTIFSAFESG